MSAEIATPPVVRPTDPSLKNLMADLPKGDPDVQPPDLIELRITFCERQPVVPKGVPVRVSFGRWRGPRMCATEISVFARNMRTGAERRIDLTGPWQAVYKDCTQTEMRPFVSDGTEIVSNRSWEA